MRKFFFCLGVIAAALVVAGTIGFSVLARNGAALDAQSKTFVNDALPTIIARWNADELWKRGTPHFREITKRDQLAAFLGAAETALGRLVEYRGADGEATMSVSNSRTTVFARYTAKARFQKGDADFRITLVKVGDAWMIEGFNIGSPLLMQSLVGFKS
jgi:hypothetical protein